MDRGSAFWTAVLASSMAVVGRQAKVDADSESSGAEVGETRSQPLSQPLSPVISSQYLRQPVLLTVAPISLLSSPLLGTIKEI